MTQVLITDAAGVKGVFTNPLTIDPYAAPKPVTVFGTTPDYNNGDAGFTAHMGLYPKSGVARVYGSDCAQWNTPHVNALVARGDMLWFSWKNFSLPALIANWNAMTKPAKYTPFHEYNRPTGGPILADYRAHITNVFKARETHHNKDLIELGPIASWFPAVHAKEAIKWEEIMDFDWDFMGWDFYNPANNSLSKPADQLALPVASGQKYGLTVNIGEWSVQPAAVVNGVPAYTEQEAADWVTGIGAEGVKNNLGYMAHWCSQASGNPNYHFENRPLPFAALQKLLKG